MNADTNLDYVAALETAERTKGFSNLAAAYLERDRQLKELRIYAQLVTEGYGNIDAAIRALRAALGEE